jgi:glycosyltransferase involved in cell wall biosynthesis
MSGILDGLRVGYAPSAPDLTDPGDRRRFCFYADRRGVAFDVADLGRDYDVVVLTAMADIASWCRRPAGRTKLVYDLVDSYLALPRFDPRSLLRGVGKFAARQTRSLVLDYRAAMERMCRRADAVACSTEEQRAQILAFCPDVHVILDAHGELGPVHKSDFALGDTVNLVWEGLPFTLGGFDGIVGVLRQLAAERPVALHLVTDLGFPRYARRLGHVQTETLARRILPDTYLYQWNRHLLPAIVTACDVALVPLDLDDPLARGKPENKLLIFWRLGMPTVTSATPAYRRTMQRCGLDLTCEGPDDWAATLRRVLGDEDLRATSSKLGREFVESNHSEEQLLARWDGLFESVLS